jgi:uncharacterized protein
MGIEAILAQPWPWYVTGPLIGLIVPLLALLGNKQFGFSANLRHACAMTPTRLEFFRYDWRRVGGWNLVFALGTILGGFLAGVVLPNPEALRVADSTVRDLSALGVAVDGDLVPAALFSWESLLTVPGFVLMVVGGMLIGFGARWAGGCTSGHAIAGLSNLQLPSLVAVIGFFLGGLVATFVVLPVVLSL